MRFPILVLHVSAGILAMLAGGFAISFRKGSQRHRAAGTLFVICMLIVSVAGAWLAFRKSEADNVLGGIFTFYLIATAWATTRHGEGTIWKIDWVTPAAALAIAALWFFWGIGVTSGRMAAGQGSSAGGYFFFGGLAVWCAAGVVRMLRRRGISALVSRINRAYSISVLAIAIYDFLACPGSLCSICRNGRLPKRSACFVTA